MIMQSLYFRHKAMPLLALLFLLTVPFTLSAPAAHAQAVTGSIVGTVTDASGAVVPNAKVVISLTGQNAVHTVTTNESGNYTQPDLPPGAYSVVITAAGFKKQAYENVSVLTNSTQRVPGPLTTSTL